MLDAHPGLVSSDEREAFAHCVRQNYEKYFESLLPRVQPFVEAFGYV